MARCPECGFSCPDSELDDCGVCYNCEDDDRLSPDAWGDEGCDSDDDSDLEREYNFFGDDGHYDDDPSPYDGNYSEE